MSKTSRFSSILLVVLAAFIGVMTVACTKSSRSNEDSLESPELELPFVGNRFVNFEGKPNTAKLVAIAIDGTTVIRSFGADRQVIDYRGQFSNLIRLKDGSSFRFKFKQGDLNPTITKLAPNGQIAQGCKTEDKTCETTLKDNLSALPIKDGRYIRAETVQAIEVKDNQYRQFVESGAMPWRELYELTPVAPGVIFDGKDVWCIPPNNQSGRCTEAGWKAG